MEVLGALVVQMGSALPELLLKTIKITYLYLTLLEKKNISVQYISGFKPVKETEGCGISTGDYLVFSSVLQSNVWLVVSHLVQ